MTDFDDLIGRVRACDPVQKQKIFQEIRDDIVIHDLEQAFGVRAEVILEAINRSADLTKRGVRGVIAETVFVLDVLPMLTGWRVEPLIGNPSYDACAVRDDDRIRIQVKMQRRRNYEPMMRRGSYVVEVQRTRTGDKHGVKTRPYRFGEFDVLAVCMQPSTHDWHSFMYAAAADLFPDSRDATVIKTLQPVSADPFEGGGIWTSNLSAVLDRCVSRRQRAVVPATRMGSGDVEFR
jgi:hypothetical protein